LHEYYIIDDWIGSRHAFDTMVGTITVDGGTYDVMTRKKTNLRLRAATQLLSSS
jgi:hypothetical protein